MKESPGLDMSILLVGCGYWGRNWANTLKSMDELSAICESPFQADVVQQLYPEIDFYEDLDLALAAKNVKGVVLATPATTHYLLARQCLEQGKSVLIEKPMTLHPDEARALNELAAEKGLVIGVGHLMMFHPALLKLKEIISDGVLGDILGVDCSRINLGQVRNEENVWWSLAPHDLSIVDLLVNEPLEPISAYKRNLLRRFHIEDEVNAHLMSQSQIPVNIRVSWLSPLKRHETIVTGSRKIAIFEDTLPDGQELQLIDYRFEQDGQRFGGIRRAEPICVPYEPAGNLLMREANAFLEAIHGRHDFFLNDGQNGLRVVELLADVQKILLQQEIPLPAMV